MSSLQAVRRPKAAMRNIMIVFLIIIISVFAHRLAAESLFVYATDIMSLSSCHRHHAGGELYGDVVEEEALPASDVVHSVLELPRAHKEQLAVGACIEELLIGFVLRVLWDALGQESDEAVSCVHDSSGYCPLARTDAWRDWYYTMLACLEDILFECLNLCLGHRSRALYLHQL